MYLFMLTVMRVVVHQHGHDLALGVGWTALSLVYSANKIG